MKKSIIFGVLGIALVLCAFSGFAVAVVSDELVIKVSSTPSNAHVTFMSDSGRSYDLGYTPTSGFKIYYGGSISPDYPHTGTLTVTKDGYYTESIKVGDEYFNYDSPKTIYVALSPIESDGYASISSSPSGASVKIDGAYYGTTPLTVSLSAGSHTVTISKSGYSSYSSSLRIIAGETSYLDASLSSANGYLSVTSYPKGASVYIDGAYVGQTDNTFAVSEGTHSITINKAGYGSYGSKVKVVAGTTSSVSAILPESSEKGYANVASTPAGASVYVDGSYVGVTPNSGYLDIGPYSTSGSHSLQFKLAGYQTYTTSFTTSTSSTPVITATLTPDQSTTGTIHVTSSPVGATVTVDGTYYGTTPVSIKNLNAGSHTVKVSAVGYVDNIQTVNVNAGQYVEHPVTLYTAAPTSASPAPIFGLLVGLAAAGVFCALRRRA